MSSTGHIVGLDPGHRCPRHLPPDLPHHVVHCPGRVQQQQQQAGGRGEAVIIQGHTNIQGLHLNAHCLKLTDPILGIPCMAEVHRGATFRLISPQVPPGDEGVTPDDLATPLMSPVPQARYNLGQYPQLYPAHAAPSAPPPSHTPPDPASHPAHAQFYPSLQ